jgi:large subunit ribosomal protein L32e
MTMTDALTQRKQIKAKKPVFLAQDTHKKTRIRPRWKRPRGLQSKVRLHKRGYRRSVSTGWRSPKAVRGLSPEGLVPIRIETLAHLEGLDPKTHGALISGRVSIKTKKILYDAARERKITILNRDANVFDERYAAKMAERDERKKRLEDKRKRQEKLKKDIEATEKSGVAAESLKEPRSGEKSAQGSTKAESKAEASKAEPTMESNAPAESKAEPKAQEATKAAEPTAKPASEQTATEASAQQEKVSASEKKSATVPDASSKETDAQKADQKPTAKKDTPKDAEGSR